MTDTPPTDDRVTIVNQAPDRTAATIFADSAQNVTAIIGAVVLQCLVPDWPHEYTLMTTMSALGVPAVAGMLGKRRGVGAAVAGLLGLLWGTGGHV